MNRYLAGRALELTCNLLSLNLEEVVRKAGIAWPKGGASELMLTAGELKRFYKALHLEYEGDDLAEKAVQVGKGHVGHIHGTGELAFLVSETAGEALNRLAKMKGWIKPEVLTFTETPAGLRLTISSADPNFPVDCATEIGCFVYVVEALRFHTKQNIPVLSAQFSGNVRCKAEIEAALGCEIEVASTNSLLLGAEVSKIPLKPAMGLRWESVEAEISLTAPAGGLCAQPFSSTIRDYIKAELINGVCAEKAACDFHISRRTLERRLAKEGMSFKEIVDNVRSELAIEYLNQPGYTNADVSYLLGFKEPTSFFRAFKRWHNKAPSEIVEASASPASSSAPSPYAPPRRNEVSLSRAG